MADDDLDLEDDDLDLGGDDFAGELDEMMGDDELGGESSGGGDDSDSELDSFFEDLSSIEDMDEGGAEPSGDTGASDEADVDEIQETPTKAKKAAPATEKKGGLLKFLIPILLLLGGGAAAIWFFVLKPPEEIPEEDLASNQVIQEQTITIKEDPIAQKPVEPPIVIDNTPKPKPKPIVPKRRYYVQVAKCTYDVCKEDYIESLRRDGEPVYQSSSNDKYDFILLISKQVFNHRDAVDVAREININNKMAGNAVPEPQSNGYRVSMGLFPALDRAKEVKFNVEKIFPGKNVTFMMEHKREDYSSTKIYAGPYDSQRKAKAVLKDLLAKKKYRGAFIVQY